MIFSCCIMVYFMMDAGEQEFSYRLSISSCIYVSFLSSVSIICCISDRIELDEVSFHMEIYLESAGLSISCLCFEHINVCFYNLWCFFLLFVPLAACWFIFIYTNSLVFSIIKPIFFQSDPSLDKKMKDIIFQQLMDISVVLLFSCLHFFLAGWYTVSNCINDGI